MVSIRFNIQKKKKIPNSMKELTIDEGIKHFCY